MEDETTHQGTTHQDTTHHTEIGEDTTRAEAGAGVEATAETDITGTAIDKTAGDREETATSPTEGKEETTKGPVQQRQKISKKGVSRGSIY